MSTLVITGGAGTIATAIRPLLAVPGRTVRLVDVRRPDSSPCPHEEVVLGSVTDRAALEEAFRGSDLVVHLGGHASERPWADLLSTNIDGTHCVLDAARAVGVERVLIASSIHAVGFTEVVDAGSGPVLPPRPDSYYGVTKVVAEALGSLFADRFGMHIVSARIANFAERPTSARGLALWFSPADMARLVEATLLLGSPGHDSEPAHHVVWGISRNSRGIVDLAASRAIGWSLRDDAEAFASEVSGTGFSDVHLGEGFLAPGREPGVPFA